MRKFLSFISTTRGRIALGVVSMALLACVAVTGVLFSQQTGAGAASPPSPIAGYWQPNGVTGYQSISIRNLGALGARATVVVSNNATCFPSGTILFRHIQLQSSNTTIGTYTYSGEWYNGAYVNNPVCGTAGQWVPVTLFVTPAGTVPNAVLTIVLTANGAPISSLHRITSPR